MRTFFEDEPVLLNAKCTQASADDVIIRRPVVLGRDPIDIAQKAVHRKKVIQNIPKEAWIEQEWKSVRHTSAKLKFDQEKRRWGDPSQSSVLKRWRRRTYNPEDSSTRYFLLLRTF